MIGALENSLLTDHLTSTLPYRDGLRLPDPAQGVHKLAVLERHGVNGNIGRGFVTGFGPLRGALACSIGHDSHNLIVVGDDDADMALAVNRLIELQGGARRGRGRRACWPSCRCRSPGLMSDRPFEEVDERLRPLRAASRAHGLRAGRAVPAAGLPAAAGDPAPEAHRQGPGRRRPLRADRRLRRSAHRVERAIGAELVLAAGAIETLRAGAPQDLEHVRQRLPFALQAQRDTRGAERVEQLERALGPVEAPAHRAIDVDDVVGDLRDQAAA